ncbi:MAG: hypothetical protein LKE30_04655 [Bacteroidales bacterium]|jgi:hypothetical protein|nr:hypothetical protein [Bacteroidales bacterium]
MNKKILIIISATVLVVLSIVSILLYLNRETSYTFIDNVSSKDSNSLTMEFTFYEYNENDEQVAVHNLSSKRGLHKKFIANEQTKKVKITLFMSGFKRFTTWVNQIYYLKKGTNTIIELNENTRIKSEEP